jgi:hypothetical protein
LAGFCLFLFLWLLPPPPRTAIGVGVFWLLYAAYETAMRQRWLCSGECNIRVDLLLLYPALLLVTLIGVVSLLRPRTGA